MPNGTVRMDQALMATNLKMEKIMNNDEFEFNAAVCGEAVARLMYWRGPSHYAVPHGGICARTYAEFSKGAGENGGYWNEGEELFTASSLSARAASAHYEPSELLYTAVMNIPCERTMSHFVTLAELRAYKEGHHAARHAAVNLVAAFKSRAADAPSEPSELQEQLDLANEHLCQAVKNIATAKNFHRSLCDRFGYCHDDKDWLRDLVSLEEFIAAKVKSRAAVCGEAVAIMGAPSSVEEKAFNAFWYGHMLEELMQPPLCSIDYSTAKYIWNSARAADAPSEPSERLNLLEEFYCASTAWENTCGHPDATADDERKAEERFIAAGKAMRTMPVKSRAADAPSEPSEKKAVAWIDQFGNVFPLGAYQPSGKPSYLDADKRGWKPLFRAADALDSQPTDSTKDTK